MTTTETTGEELLRWTGAVVKRMKALFKPYPHLDREALMSEGMDFARKSVTTYKPDKGAGYCTWASVCVWRGLKTIHRTAEREAKRDRAHGAAVAYHHRGRAFEDVDESLPVDEYISAIYRQAVHTAGRIPTGRGCRIYEPAQEAALLAIKKRCSISNRGVVFFLADRPKLVSTLRLSRLPSFDKIDRLCRRISTPTANKRASGRNRSNRSMSAYITEKQAAELVGLSWMTLRRWRCKRNAKFTVYRPGGRVRYLKTEVVKWMEAQAVRPGQVA